MLTFERGTPELAEMAISSLHDLDRRGMSAIAQIPEKDLPAYISKVGYWLVVDRGVYPPSKTYPRRPLGDAGVGLSNHPATPLPEPQERAPDGPLNPSNIYALGNIIPHEGVPWMGEPWMVGSPAIRGKPGAVFSIRRKFRSLERPYKFLYGLAVEDNKDGLKLLQVLGFTVGFVECVRDGLTLVRFWKDVKR